ncbi:tetratricopeptide repeat protein [Streptomyces sp. PAN_FS17]|uniref:tetratricopeptide repeat protein n=1 Tax=Streptomyces sp. PAN_FS17 TaxID=1855351 RepID=UPI0008948F5F|nr:Tetratricopeptide repeat-containing protein [Streptomyces sp. PAN_FS17]
MSVVVALVQGRQPPVPVPETDPAPENGTRREPLLGDPDASRSSALNTANVARTLRPPTGRLGQLHGRDDVLELLGGRLSAPDGCFLVLAGMGGTGKTSLALALAERAERQGRRVWWVSATEQRSLVFSLLGLALGLGAPPAQVEEARAGVRNPADVLWQYLEVERGWLLIFDNADDPGVLALSGDPARDGTGWLRPTSAGLIVVTSRTVDQRTWGRHSVVLPVSCLDAAAGARVLQSLAPHAGSPEEAQALSRRLGGLPLALHQAGDYLASPFAVERTFTAYLEALDDRFPLLMGQASDPRSGVTHTWELSLDALAVHGSAQTRPLLRVLSCFAPSADIASALLDPRVLGQDLGIPETSVRSGLEALLSVGLLELGTAPGPNEIAGVVVHPLVAAASRQHLDLQITAAAAHALRVAAGRLRPDAPEDWPIWLRLLPHVRSLLCLPPAALDDRGLSAITWAVVSTCSALRWSGAWSAPETLTADALHQAESLGPAHEALLSLRYQHALTALYQGRLAEAESQLSGILTAQLTTLRPDHPATLATRHELAHLFVEQGRLAKAESTCREVLWDQLRVLGPDHPETLATRHWLLRAVGERGRYAEAEAGYRDLLRTRSRVLGPEHPYTLMTYNNLGLQLAYQGRFAEADLMYSELIETRLRVFGSQHPYTLQARANRAGVLTELGRGQEAEAELRDVLETEVRMLGAEHVNVLDARYELAQAISAQGRHEEAERELREVIDVENRVLGPEHHLVGHARLGLGQTLASLGRHEEAVTELRALLDVQTRTLGPTNPRTAATRQYLDSLESTGT